MTGALPRLVAEAARLGRLFFCDIRATTAASDLDPTMGRAVALAEQVLGPSEAVEKRQGPGNTLVQILHRSGAIAQITVRRAAEENLAVEVDGDSGSLRLDGAGRLVRHDTTTAVVMP